MKKKVDYYTELHKAIRTNLGSSRVTSNSITKYVVTWVNPKKLPCKKIQP